jgi:recombinational DNA repair protein (RecF pathway)
MRCGECGKEIQYFSTYYKHETGAILCKKCFEKLVKKGKII